MACVSRPSAQKPCGVDGRESVPSQATGILPGAQRSTTAFRQRVPVLAGSAVTAICLEGCLDQCDAEDVDRLAPRGLSPVLALEMSSWTPSDTTGTSSAVWISGQLRAKAFDTFLVELSPGRSGNPHSPHQLRTLFNAKFRFLARLRSPSRHLIPHFTSCPGKSELYSTGTIGWCRRRTSRKIFAHYRGHRGGNTTFWLGAPETVIRCAIDFDARYL